MASNVEPSDVTDELLVTVGDKLYPQHLQSFATTLIGLSVDEYERILKDAEDDPAKQGIQASSYFLLNLCFSSLFVNLIEINLIDLRMMFIAQCFYRYMPVLISSILRISVKADVSSLHR